MYTNIPNGEGLAASMRALECNRPGQVKPTNLTIIKMLEMVLKKNNFQFNGEHFLQVGGTAIGTKAAPSFAVVYMGDFEDKYVYPYHKQPQLYLRYIDDIFMLWQHGPDELEVFFNHLNSRVDTIKFTIESSREEIAFLDVKVKLVDNRVITDLYCKPTDSHDYLLYSSSHPQRCKDSIPYSQFLRIRRLCSNLKDFERHILTFALHFKRRLYPTELIVEAARLTRNLDRKVLLDDTLREQRAIENSNEDAVFLITTFHPSDHTVRDIVHKNWDILGQNDETNFLYKKRLITGYRRPKNLRDLLVNANIPRAEEDDQVDPWAELRRAEVAPVLPLEALPPNIIRKQKHITDFFTQRSPTLEMIEEDPGSDNIALPRTSQHTIGRPRRGTAPKYRGFNFCGAKRHCRFCPSVSLLV